MSAALAMFGRPRNTLLFAATLLLSGTAIAALGLRHPAPRRLPWNAAASARARVQPTELAQWIIEGRRDFTVIDLRDDAHYQAGHVRDAVHCGSCHDSKAEGQLHQEEHFVDLSKKLVLYTETGRETIELPRLLAENPRLVLLEGGWQGFREGVLAPLKMGGETDARVLEGKRKREAVRAFFAGEKQGGAAPAQLPVTPIRRDSAHKTAAAHEGC
jgi:rhodanese-related sulfurtransferase